MTKIISFKNLDITILKSPEMVLYTFNGSVDENFKQQDIPRIAMPSVIFELEGIHNFNSCGIREWVHFMNDMNPLGKITFKKCSITMIDQINLVPNTLGNARIESFQAPYYCQEHGELVCNVDVDTSLVRLKAKQAPTIQCPSCQKTLEFDALEESYFLFAENLAVKP